MKPHLRYLWYVIRHKWFVFVAGSLTRAPLWRLLIHDWSKFRPSEWFPYVANFYGESVDSIAHRDYQTRMARAHYDFEGEVHVSFHAKLLRHEQELKERLKNKRRTAFDIAWLRHQHRNPHHWQHWVLREDSGATKVLQMPDHFVREMVADWMGAGRAITGKWEVEAWYEKNKHQILLHPVTRGRVEVLIAAWGKGLSQ
jgi:hypothetical protein